MLDGVFRYLMQGQIGANGLDRETMKQVFRTLLGEVL
jgi:hypothetical protein